MFGLFWSWTAAREERKGDAARAAGRPLDAVEFYAKALERHEKRNPESEKARALRARLAEAQAEAARATAQRARLAQEFGDYNAARYEMDEALRLAPSDAVREELAEIERTWRRGPRRDASRRRGGRGRGRDREERAPRAAEPEAPTPAPVPEGPQIIDEAYVTANLPRRNELTDPAITRALTRLPLADAEHARTLGREFGAGYLALVEGRIHDALDGLEAALREHPGEPLVLEMYAQALREAGLPQARAALETLVRHFPERGSAVLTLAELLLDHGDPAAAKLALETAIDANREGDERDERLELRLAEVLAAEGDTSAAFELLQDLAADAGEASPALLTVAARVARAAGDRESEGLYLRQAAQQSHAPSEAHEAYADFLFDQGDDPTRALHHLAAARRRLSEDTHLLPSDVERHLHGQVRLLVKSARARLRGGHWAEAAECIEEIEAELSEFAPPELLVALREELEAAKAAEPAAIDATAVAPAEAPAAEPPASEPPVVDPPASAEDAIPDHEAPTASVDPDDTSSSADETPHSHTTV